VVFLATPFDSIFTKFYKRLVNDTKYFNYGSSLTAEQVKQLVEDHTIDLLNQSIDMIYFYGTPKVDFYDKDDTLQKFNFDLVNQEIALFVDLMYQKLFDEDKNKLHAFGLTFTSSELRVFSPSEDRKTFLDMLKNLETSNINAIYDYFSRNRKDWSRKSIYDT
jgi:hypothetical protein